MVAEVVADPSLQRAEMFSTSLAGETEPPAAHLFVVYGATQTWGERLEEVEGSPIHVLKPLLKKHKLKVTVTAVPEGECGADRAGDVLVFPHRLRLPNGVARAGELLEALAGVQGLAPAAAGAALAAALGGAARPLERGGHIFVCAHAQRDVRCGLGGPKILAALRAHLAAREPGAAPRSVAALRSCSHVGGHRYAGNAIVFRDDAAATCDWLGYLSDSAEDAEYIVDLATGALETPNPATWRGRAGLSAEQHKAACAACLAESGAGARDIEDLLRQSKEAKPSVLFVLGGPGSGKGTQCELISEAFDFCHLSAGELLRAERQRGSPFGAEIERHIKQGSIVPAEITTALLLNAMRSSGRRNFLIDGFPRNADNLDGWKRVVKNQACVLGVLFFDCPEREMERRLLERGKTSGRTDDNLDSVRKRFRTFAEHTMPVVDLYTSRGKTLVVRSDRPVQAVFGDVSALLVGKLGFKPRSGAAMLAKPGLPSARAMSTSAAGSPNPTLLQAVQRAPTSHKVLLGTAGAVVLLAIGYRVLRKDT
jgi:UMP-CMP kinase